MIGYHDRTNWRSFKWAMREMGDYLLHFRVTRSVQDILNLWLDREVYVRKYHPELIHE